MGLNWKCPFCLRTNDRTREICPCGEAHRDEKRMEEPRKDFTTDDYVPVAMLVIGLLSFVALIVMLIRGA